MCLVQSYILNALYMYCRRLIQIHLYMHILKMCVCNCEPQVPPLQKAIFCVVSNSFEVIFWYLIVILPYSARIHFDVLVEYHKLCNMCNLVQLICFSQVWNSYILKLLNVYKIPTVAFKRELFSQNNIGYAMCKSIWHLLWSDKDLQI